MIAIMFYTRGIYAVRNESLSEIRTGVLPKDLPIPNVFFIVKPQLNPPWQHYAIRPNIIVRCKPGTRTVQAYKPSEGVRGGIEPPPFGRPWGRMLLEGIRWAEELVIPTIRVSYSQTKRRRDITHVAVPGYGRKVSAEATDAMAGGQTKVLM
jgi:hypothetical protein